MSNEAHGPITSTTDPIPQPKFPLKLSVDGYDGVTAVRRFTRDGKPEIWLYGLESPPDRENVHGRVHVDPETKTVTHLQTWVMPLIFDNYPLAEHAAHALENAFEQVNAFSKMVAETVDDGHKHEVVLERFARRLPQHATCKLCLTVLVEDVVEWWKDEQRRDDLGPGFDGTMIQAVEQVFNRGR